MEILPENGFFLKMDFSENGFSRKIRFFFFGK